MSSEQNNSTSFPPTTAESKLCDNGCGFFGSSSNMNLCSKCYRSLRAGEDQTSIAKAAVKNSLNLLTKEPNQKQSLEPFKPVKPVVVLTVEPVKQNEAELSKPPTKPKNRCFSCNKKVGVMGFKCKCGSMFCGEHRYPEKHECSFDFKEVGRDAIAKANPLVKADKVHRF